MKNCEVLMWISIVLLWTTYELFAEMLNSMYYICSYLVCYGWTSAFLAVLPSPVSQIREY